MSGDTEKPLAEIDSSVVPAPGLDSNIEAEENGSKLDDGTFVNGDHGSCGENEVEMNRQDEVLNGKGDDVVENDGVENDDVENDDMDGDGKEVDEEEKQDESDKDHKFYVGKLVWGKIRNNPWWPGQIYDPSNASDYAKKLQKSKKLLVAFFGDDSFSWCSPSQLKPFAEDFEKMSKQSTSKKFICAVEEALDEFGRLIESTLSQSFNLSEKSQIRQGVLVPIYDTSEIPQLQPVKIISLLRDIARKATFSCMFEFTVSRSWLSAFYRANGKDELAVFYEPQGIGELDSNEGSYDDDSVPSQHEFSVSNQALLRKCEGVEAEKLYKRRKRKSVSKLMKEDKIVEPNNENDLKAGKRKTRASEEEDPNQSVLEVNSISGTKKGKKKSENIKSLKEVLIAEKDQASSSKEDDIVKLVSTNGKKNKNGLVSIKDKVLKAKKSGDKGQPLDEIKNKNIEKVNKITIGETESVAGNEEKKGNAKGKSIEKAGEDLVSLSRKSARKRKQNEALVEISGKKEGTKTGSKNKESSSENDKLEETENQLPKDKELRTKKVIKIIIETKNGAASGEKRVTKEKSLEKAGEDLASQLRKSARKRKQNEVLDELSGKKEDTKNGSKNKISSSESDKLEKTENARPKDKEPDAKKAEKIIEKAENGAASGEKRATRSSVRGSKEKSGDKTANHREEVLSKKRKQTEKLESPKIKVIKENPQMGKDMVIGRNNYNQEETENVIRSPREKKKSMYLSPPFINYNSISRSLSPKTARMGERISKIASEVIGSTPTSKSNEPGLVNISIEEEKKIIALVQISVSMKEVISEIRSAALNPLILWDKKFLDTVEGFMFAYRNANYLNGSYYQKYNCAQQDQKQKEASKPVSIMVIFPPGFSLPSKSDLIAAFSKFGPIKEEETNVLIESHCAKVVFLSNSDTEKAFDTCLKESPFEPAKVNYRLRYSVGSSKAKEIEKKSDSAEFEASSVLFIKQKLKIMTKMVDNCGGNLSSELVGKLENETKGLLDKISSITEPNSA